MRPGFVILLSSCFISNPFGSRWQPRQEVPRREQRALFATLKDKHLLNQGFQELLAGEACLHVCRGHGAPRQKTWLWSGALAGGVPERGHGGQGHWLPETLCCLWWWNSENHWLEGTRDFSFFLSTPEGFFFSVYLSRCQPQLAPNNRCLWVHFLQLRVIYASRYRLILLKNQTPGLH